jgi:two-component system nitrate/nitrite response regulator NarL
VAGGVEPVFAATLRATCASSRSCELWGVAEDPGQLIDVAEQAGRSRRVLVVIAGRWLRDEGLELLIEMRRVTRNPAALAVGADLQCLGLGHALRLGLRGLVESGASVDQLSRALTAIATGELWLSRRLVLDALLMLSPPEPEFAAEPWIKLPTLTAREREVLMQVLDGQPNKSIARQLGMSEQTVKIHLVHAYRKLGVRRRIDLLKAFADTRTGLPQPVMSSALQSA